MALTSRSLPPDFETSIAPARVLLNAWRSPMTRPRPRRATSTLGPKRVSG